MSSSCVMPVSDGGALVPTIKLRGDAEARGHQHGSLLKERIGLTWAWYLELFTRLMKTARGGEEEMDASVVEERLKSLADTYKSATEAFDKEQVYCREIEGIAAGSGLDAWKIYCINSRTEIMYTLKREVIKSNSSAPEAAAPATAEEQNESELLPSECTSLYASEFSVLAQNWDWCEDLEPLIVLFDVVREDGHAFLSVNEPGMLAKIGVSSAGVGVLLNALDAGTYLEEESRPPLDGVPIHVLLRCALDAPSYDVALERIEGCHIGTSSHILIGAADGRSALCEFAGTKLDVDRSDAAMDRESATQFRVHTNHFLGCGLEAHPTHGFPAGAARNNTRARYERATQLVAELDRMGTAEDAVANAKMILGDTLGITGDCEWPICLPYTHKSLTGGGASAMVGKTGTVATVVMELSDGRMHVTRGNPRDHEYETETISFSV